MPTIRAPGRPCPGLFLFSKNDTLWFVLPRESLMILIKVFQLTLILALMIVAMIGGTTEKWWLVLVVVLCLVVWVLYLLVQQEKNGSALETANTTLTQTRKELENYKRLRVRRVDLLSRHVD